MPSVIGVALAPGAGVGDEAALGVGIAAGEGVGVG